MAKIATAQRKSALDLIQDQRGFLMIDFIFALVFSIGFAAVFFSVAVTLSLVEAAQYVTFATSRAYLAAHETKDMQKDLALAKYQDLLSKGPLKTFLGGDVLKLGDPQVGDFSEEYDAASEGDNMIYVGARIPIDAKLLHLQVPFLGPTIDASDVGKATLNSYLMREVSTTECREQFTRQRFQQLKNLDGAPYQATPNSKPEFLITDNGC